MLPYLTPELNANLERLLAALADYWSCMADNETDRNKRARTPRRATGKGEQDKDDLTASKAALKQLREEGARNNNKCPVVLQAIQGLQCLDALDGLGWIYFLAHKNEVVYVGQTIHGISRIRNHVSSGKRFDTVYYVEVGVAMLDETEREWIRRLRPRYNGQLPPEKNDGSQGTKANAD
jgi:hypothetical protein